MPDALTGSSTTPSRPVGVLTETQTTAAAAAKDAKPGGDLGKDAFLKLLVAQLKYQNPLSPTNPDQFLAQTAQFTMVEKLEEISRAQSDLAVWQKVAAGQSLVGRQVTGTNELGSAVTGVVTGLTLGAAGPQLVLADGSKLPVLGVTAVSAPTGSTLTAPAATSPAAATPAPAAAPAATPTAPAAAPAGTPTAEASEPAAGEPAAPEPPAVEPSAVEPVTAEPVTAEPVTAEQPAP